MEPHTFSYLLLLISYLAIEGISASPADLICSDCKVYADGFCLNCLSSYHRTFNQTTSLYDCLPEFREAVPLQEYCCHISCQDCSDSGCLTCPIHKSLVIDEDLKNYTICMCSDRYQQDPKTGVCKCPKQSNGLTFLYYENGDASRCLKCPNGCVCSNEGCISCSSDTYRVIRRDPTTWRSTCPCEFYMFDNQTQCIPREYCGMPSDYYPNGYCALSKRSYNPLTRDYECDAPYLEEEGVCELKQNYYEKDLGIQCLSSLRPAEYYWHGNQCLRCPEGCTCNEYGCVQCSGYKIQALGSICTCVDGFVLLDGYKCYCVHPYIIKSESCVCKSELFPTLYYNLYDEQTETSTCLPCPEMCTCNSSGCISCDPLSYRNVTQKANAYVCPCISGAAEVAGLCSCINGRNSSDTSGTSCFGCPTGMYMPFQSIQCTKCPGSCTCTEDSCHSCDPNSLWEQSTSDPVNYPSRSVCKCKIGAVLDIWGECVCGANMNESAGTCVCQDNFVMNGSKCQCNIKSGLYYYDPVRHQCNQCPQNCLCDESGCYSCSTETGRYIYQVLNEDEIGSKYVCDCLKGRTIFSSFCSTCPTSYYLFNNVCTKCPINCQVCDQKRCLYCKSDTTLNKTTGLCECNDPLKIPDENQPFCRCRLGRYLDKNWTDCLPCPYYCHSCVLNHQTLTPYCLSCSEANNRMFRTELNCPCKPGFHQTLENLEYCCPLNCQTCDRQGCLTCHSLLRHVLNPETKKCECLPGMIAADDRSVCSCPAGTYLYDQACYPCPEKCIDCYSEFYLYSLRIICTACKSNTNRDPADSCECLTGFVEADDSSLCYPKHCQTQTLKCEQCTNPRVPSKNGTVCMCPQGFYDHNDQCLECKQGCLSCNSDSDCIQCNSTGGYQLIFQNCIWIVKEQNFTVSQKVDSIKASVAYQLPVLKQVKAYFKKTQQSPSSDLNSSVDAQVISYEQDLQKGLLFVQLAPPKQKLLNYILVVVVVSYDEIKSTFLVRDGQRIVDLESYISNLNLPVPSLYSQQQISAYDSILPLSYCLCFLVLLFSLAVYVKGFRPNITMFYLQTMAFLALTLPDPDLGTVPFLFILRPIWFLFDLNIATKIGISQLYIEKVTQGNFRIFCTDSNFIRIGFFPLVFGVATQLTRGVLNLLLIESGDSSKPAYKVRKTCLKVLDFLRKCFMYPVLFLSCFNVINYVKGVSYVGPSSVNMASLIISAVLIAFYLLLTIKEMFEVKLNVKLRNQNAIEFFGNLVASIVLSVCNGSSSCRLIAVVILLKHLASLMVQLSDLRELWLMKLCVVWLCSTIFQVISVLILGQVPSVQPIMVLIVFSCYLSLVSGAVYDVWLANYTKMIITRRIERTKLEQEKTLTASTAEINDDLHSRYDVASDGSVQRLQKSLRDAVMEQVTKKAL